MRLVFDIYCGKNNDAVHMQGLSARVHTQTAYMYSRKPKYSLHSTVPVLFLVQDYAVLRRVIIMCLSANN